MGAEIDAAADRFELRHRIESTNVLSEPDRVQRKSERKATDASADDDDIVLTRSEHGALSPSLFDEDIGVPALSPMQRDSIKLDDIELDDIEPGNIKRNNETSLRHHGYLRPAERACSK
jgi:hypothetical protein